jgi:hypothetical protein
MEVYFMINQIIKIYSLLLSISFVIATGLNAADTIRVISATYGDNCGATFNNAVQYVSDACNGRTDCNYLIDHRRIGDPV